MYTTQKLDIYEVVTPNKSRTHLAPYIAIPILLTIFPTLQPCDYFTKTYF